MIDYSKGKIYMLEPATSYEEGEIYYGSTTQPLFKRLNQHKKFDCKSKILFEKYGIESIKIILIKNFSCNNKEELHAEEAKFIRENKCVNLQIPRRTRKEYQEDNKENIKVSKKIYNEANKDKIKEYYEKIKDKVKEYQEVYYQTNKDKIKEINKKYREKNKEEISKQKKEYREENKEKVKENKKEYKEKNKAKIKEKAKIYREQNKEKINEKNKKYRDKIREGNRIKSLNIQINIF